jgi:hypothetical protein
MGITEHRHPGGVIHRFWPDDDENTIYIAGSESLVEILRRAQEKWPDGTQDQISIEADYIHTDCLYYDLYDSGDWTRFLIVRRLQQ